MKFFPSISDSIVVYRSQQEKMMDEMSMKYLEENATWLYPTMLVGFGLFFLAVVSFIIYNAVKMVRFNRDFHRNWRR